MREGVVAPAVAAEHPGLRLVWTEVAARPGRTPPDVRARLRALADRMHGGDAIALRTREVPHAYRVFFRHVGLEPDEVRTPVEEQVLRRMLEGGLRSQDLVSDALTIAVLETGVGVWAFDAAALTGAPRIAEEDGRLVLADEQGPLAVLFDEPQRAVVAKATLRIALVAVAVPGVADVYVEEALWIATGILDPSAE